MKGLLHSLASPLSLALGALLLLSACGRTGDPVARIQFAKGSSANAAAGTSYDGCTVAGGMIASYTVSGETPVSRYGTESFFGQMSGILLNPTFALDPSLSTLEVAVAPSVANILMGAAYMVQGSQSQPDCNKRSSPSETYHRLVFPMLGFSAQRTFNRSEDVALRMTYGPPLSLTVPSPTPSDSLTLPTVPSGMRMVKVPTIGVSMTVNTAILGYAVVEDEESGFRALALAYTSNTLPPYGTLASGCNSLISGGNCVGYQSKVISTIAKGAQLDEIIGHYLGPLIPGRTYTLRWERVTLGASSPPPAADFKCVRKAQVRVPFGRNDVPIELAAAEMIDCANESPRGLPGHALFTP